MPPTTLPVGPSVGLPVPPPLPTNPTLDAVFTLVLVVLVAAILLYTVRLRLREGSWLPLLLVVGGGVAALAEPIATVNGLVRYPDRAQQWTSVEAYGHPVPWLVPLSYVLEVGFGALLAYRALAEGRGGPALLRIWAGIALFDAVMESPAIWLHVFRYYGHQPFDLWGFPLWWAPLDASICLLPTLAAYFLRGAPRRWWHAPGLLVLFPSSQAVVYLGTGWPVMLLLNTAQPAPYVWLACCLTLALVGGYALGAARVADAMPALRQALRAPTTPTTGPESVRSAS